MGASLRSALATAGIVAVLASPATAASLAMAAPVATAASRAMAAPVAMAASLEPSPDLAGRADVAAGAGAEGGSKPVAVVVAHADGAETTDFLVPWAILARSGAFELSAVSTTDAPVRLHPALTVDLDETTASFDARHPDGADVVVVPAQHHRDDPALIAWLKRQAERGATLVAICDGVWTVAGTGVLDGKRATGHWYSLDDLEEHYPSTTWVRERRFVRDGAVVTTTGVTASIPASLALVESVAGPERARELAAEIGVRSWDARHDSGRFVLSTRDVLAAARNWLAPWGWETVGIPVEPGTDEIGLALAADALSRTYRTSAVAIADDTKPIRLKHGITVVPDARADAVDRVEPLPGPEVPPAATLDHVLASIAARYGEDTADFVALQIEHPDRDRSAAVSGEAAGGSPADP